MADKTKADLEKEVEELQAKNEEFEKALEEAANLNVTTAEEIEKLQAENADLEKQVKVQAEEAEEPLFKAKLLLRDLNKYRARFKVDPQFEELDLDHIEIRRDLLPIDDDFNMDFLSAELDAEKMDKKTLKKQTTFRRWAVLELIIR